jgi:hypothetical protein
MSTNTTIITRPDVVREPEQPPTPSSEVTRDDEQILESIAHGLAESVLQATDEEILAEVREEGHDPLRKAEEIRSALLKATQTVSSAQADNSYQNLSCQACGDGS